MLRYVTLKNYTFYYFLLYIHTVTAEVIQYKSVLMTHQLLNHKP